MDNRFSSATAKSPHKSLMPAVLIHLAALLTKSRVALASPHLPHPEYPEPLIFVRPDFRYLLFLFSRFLTSGTKSGTTTAERGDYHGSKKYRVYGYDD